MRWILIFLIWTTAAVAVEPEEMLPDPVLEQRAQNLDALIRCVQCRSENIASSNADWARDARVLVREMIAAGATDQDVLDRFVRSYGEVVLMKPTMDGMNVLLWLAAPFLFVVTCFGFFAAFRGGSSGELDDGRSSE